MNKLEVKKFILKIFAACPKDQGYRIYGVLGTSQGGCHPHWSHYLGPIFYRMRFFLRDDFLFEKSK